MLSVWRAPCRVDYHYVVTVGKNTTKSRNRQTISGLFQLFRRIIFYLFRWKIQTIKQSGNWSEKQWKKYRGTFTTAFSLFGCIGYNQQREYRDKYQYNIKKNTHNKLQLFSNEFLTILNIHVIRRAPPLTSIWLPVAFQLPRRISSSYGSFSWP